MIEKIKEIVKKFNLSKGYGTTDADLFESIRECGKQVWDGNEEGRRHWIEYDIVVEFEGMFIKYGWAKGAGDIGVFDAGWEFDPSTICQVEPKEIKTTIYVPKKT